MKKVLKRYLTVIIAAAVMAVLTIVRPEIGTKALNISGASLLQMLLVIPPIFVLLGLLDVWVPRETMVKYMGEGSGLKGIVLSFVLGSAAAGPLYGAFPVAAIFMKKGAKFSNILIFLGAWSTTKIPMLIFEITALGAKFALTRLLVDIPGIILIAFTLAKLIPQKEVQAIYQKAQENTD